MKLIILQEKLKEAINLVSRLSAKSITFPILSNILLKTQKNFLSLSSTNLELGITFWLLANIKKEGDILIPTQTFQNLINYLPNKPISLEKENSFLKIDCLNYKTRLKGFKSEDFPIFPKIEKNISFSLPCQPFVEKLNKIFPIASTSTTKPEISGIHFSFQNNILKMAATDSFRLAETKLNLENTPSEVISFILPQIAAREISYIFSEREGELKLYFTPNQVFFEYLMLETEHPQILFLSRLIEGEFPNYQEIIPKDFNSEINLSKNEFLNQIKVASLLSGKTNEIKIRVNPEKNEIEIRSQNPDFGEYFSHLPAKIKGKAVEVSFNHRFLSEGLSNIKTAEVFLGLSNSEGPAVLKPVDSQDYLYIVMPIKG